GIRDRNVTGVQTCALPICFSLLTGSHVIQKPASKKIIPFVRAIYPTQIKNTPIIRPIPVSIPILSSSPVMLFSFGSNGYSQCFFEGETIESLPSLLNNLVR